MVTRRSVLTLTPVLLLMLACGGPGAETDDDLPEARDTTAAEAPREQAPDSARTTPYYVHLVAGAEPDSVARRNGIEPIELIREPRPGFYARLTEEQRANLEEDSLVRSLAREIHTGESGPTVPVGGLRSDSTGSL